jgi:uncharacterized protein
MNEAFTQKPFPRIWPSIGWIIFYFVLQLACTFVAIAIAAANDPQGMTAAVSDSTKAMSDPSVALSVVWGLVGAGVITLFVLAFNLRHQGRLEAMGFFAKSRLSLVETFGLAAVLLIGAFVLNWAYTTYVVPGVELQADIVAMLKALDGTTMGLVLKFIAVALLAPAIEEILFRGYLQTALSNRMNHHVAIWLAALVFAAVHLQPLATPALMVLGAAFGYLYHRTGSLLTCIVLHMVNNAAALVFSG